MPTGIPYLEEVHVCGVRECDRESIVEAEVEFDNHLRVVYLCRRHLPLAMGDALFMEYLKDV